MKITQFGERPVKPKNRPIDTVIEFTHDAEEHRVEDGVDGKPDRPYTITYKRGQRLECTEATAYHWIVRGKAKRLNVAPATAPAAPSLPLPPAA